MRTNGRTTTVLFAGALLASLFATVPASGADDLTPIPPGPHKPYLELEPGQLGAPSTHLGPNEIAKFLRGRAIFDHAFTPAEGLGTPELNADSCRACHQDPMLGGSGGLELNVSRIGYVDGGEFINLPGGQGLSKLRPPAFDDRENYVEHVNNVFEQRQTPSTFGLGLIDTIPDAAILARQDPTDRNGDGIYGIAHIIMVNGQPEVGKFGWKAQVPQLADFGQDAMAGENGITTPDDGRGFGAFTDADAVGDPELTPSQLSDLEFFMLNLGPPIRGGSTDPDVAAGRILFTTLSCAVCHAPSMPSTTGRRVRAYTDLLLHNVWGLSYSGMAEPGAPSGFFRTSPLWGIKDTAPYMHDGRAETLTDAINVHTGEAAASQLAFSLMSQAEKDKLILFLEDL